MKKRILALIIAITLAITGSAFCKKITMSAETKAEIESNFQYKTGCHHTADIWGATNNQFEAVIEDFNIFTKTLTPEEVIVAKATKLKAVRRVELLKEYVGGSDYGTASGLNYWAKESIKEARKAGNDVSFLSQLASLLHKRAAHMDASEAVQELVDFFEGKKYGTFLGLVVWVQLRIDNEEAAGVAPNKVAIHKKQLTYLEALSDKMNIKIHTIKEGETFSEVCEKETGKGKMSAWKKEAIRLGLENPDLIFPNDMLHFNKKVISKK